MFLDNKYTNLYFRIIASPDNVGYTETHHIIPKSLGGGNNKENLVTFSSRKHFLCHYLLLKMLPHFSPAWRKMLNAFILMSASSKGRIRYFNSRYYSNLRESFSITQSLNQTGVKNSQFGTMWVNNGILNKKIKRELYNKFEGDGFSAGKIKKKSEVNEVEKVDRVSEIYDNLKPLFERFMKGESLRQLSNDYGKSHIQLRKDFILCFKDQYVKVKHGSKNRTMFNEPRTPGLTARCSTN